MWISFAEAVKRAGTLEACLRDVHDRLIPARAEGFYTSDGSPAQQKDRHIPVPWWQDAHDIDHATGRAYFTVAPLGAVDGSVSTYDLLATGIEFDWPATAAVRHAGGRDPDHAWEDAAQHVDDWIAKHKRRLPRNKKGEPIIARAVDLMTEWFNDNDPPPPEPRSIRRWIKDHPHPHWWLTKLVRSSSVRFGQ